MARADNISVLPSKPDAPRAPVAFVPPVRSARLRRRHVALAFSFALMVIAPIVISAGYLWIRATDQFASTVAFSVRSEEPTTGLELLGGIADVSGGGASDNDILYDFLGSQHIVEQLQTSLSLDAIWGTPKKDPIFAFAPTGQIEDLHAYWERMVTVSHDTSRGIIEVHTRTFKPDDARAINEAILQAATELINQINNVARDDAVRFALGDLQRSKDQLTQARRALTEFRISNEMVDPTLDAEIQSNLIATLDAELTETLIEIEILSSTTRASDIRLNQLRTRANVLRARIVEERQSRAMPRAADTSIGIAELFGTYERLLVDVEFAQERYQASRASFDAALSDAQRITRYLAAHILPTRAQKSQYPQRELILAMIALGALLTWCLLSLIAFSFLDRR